MCNVLAWEDIIYLVGKPIWDNVSKKWRVLKEYSEDVEHKIVKFTDLNWDYFKEDRYYRYEIEEGEE